MRNDDYATPKGRTNNLISAEQVTSPYPICLFTNPQILSPPVSALKGECQRRGIPVEIYSEPNELVGLVSRLKQKALIVIETPRVSATEVSWVFPEKFDFPKSGENVKIVTFPGRVASADYEQAKEKNDVLAIYDRMFGGATKEASKIKLRKVHSSKDIKYELASPQSIKQTKAGKEVFFHKLLYSDYKVQPDSEFKMLTESIKNTPNTFACLNLNELKTAVDSLPKGGKLLMLVDERGLKEWREYVERMKVTERVEMMVLGDLKPNKELLRSYVYFASDNGQQILNQLERLKFQQVDRCRGEFVRLSTTQKNQFKFSEQSIKVEPYSAGLVGSPQVNLRVGEMVNNNNINNRLLQKTDHHRMSEQFSASIFSNASSQFERYMRNWTVDIDPSTKDRRRAQYVMVEEEGKQHIEGPSEPMSKRASRIGRRNSSESSEERYSQTTNNLKDEYYRMKNRDPINTAVNISMPNQLQLHNLKNNSHSHKEITTPTKQPTPTTVVSPKSGSKKIIQIMKKPSQKQKQSKYQQPSNVIQETSQEYRGSNRESIVNMDDHFYHPPGQSGNNLGGSAGNVPAGSFSKVKTAVVQPVEQAGVRRSVQMGQSYPVSGNMTAGLGYDSPYKQELPIQSPSHSQVETKPRLIDGLTGELIGNYDLSKFALTTANPVNEKINKKAYETTTVLPYQTDPIKTSGSSSGGIDPKRLGYGFEYELNNGAPLPFMIDGLTGELVGESKTRMEAVNVAGQYEANVTTSVSKPQQILRPSHYIEPQIVKIQSESAIINDRGSKQSIATQKKIANNNNNLGGYNSISQNMQSATSITQSYGTNSNNIQAYGAKQPQHRTSSYNTQRTTYHKASTSNPITTQRVNSPSIHNYNSSTTPVAASYAFSGNYKVYTPEEYAARYEKGNSNHNNPTRVSSVLNNVATVQAAYHDNGKNSYSSSNDRNGVSSLNSYSYNHSSQQPLPANLTKKQPQVIERVYIKASDLPQRELGVNHYSTSTRRYETSPNNNVYSTHQYKTTKLSVEDTDPFNQRTPSKNSSLRRGSYLKRKEDGKRDPYSPYEQNGSRLVMDQKSGVKVYTSEEYQKMVENRRLGSPGKDLVNGIDLAKYDRVVENGVAVYKPKGTFSTASNKVQTKTIQPSRDNYQQSKVTVVNGYQSGGITRYEPTGRDYANSPTRREGSSYEKALRSENPLRRPSNEGHEGKYTSEVSRNIKPLRDQRVTPLVYDSRSPMKVTEYRAGQTKNPSSYTYTSPTKHAYERRQPREPRVQASNQFDRVEVKQPQLEKQPQQEIGVISGIHKNSQIFELSDGSIMRRNNIRFGVGKYGGKNSSKEESFEYLGQMKSRVQSKVVSMSEIRGNFALEVRLVNEQQVVVEKEAYAYVSTAPNEFYFLFDDELNHLSSWVSKYLKTKNDKIELFRGIDQLYQILQKEKVQRQFDVTFVFAKAEDLPKINKKLLPEDCYVVEIVGEEFRGLEVLEKEKRICLNRLPYLRLAQKIIVEAMLTHIVLYQRVASANNNNNSNKEAEYFNKQVSHLLSLFPDGQFIKQPYTSPLTMQMINSLIEDPKFSRLYIICNQKQMTNVVEQLSRIDEESQIPQEICKIICIPQDNEILKHEKKIQSYPRVAWMTNASRIGDYRTLVRYALRQEEEDNPYYRQDSQQREKIFYHNRHRNLNTMIEKEFPSRFEFEAFSALGEVEKKIMKEKAQRAKESVGVKKLTQKQKANNLPTTNYLILHPILSDEYIDTKLFKKIFMLGKSDKTQRKVVKVSSNEELMELLKR